MCGTWVQDMLMHLKAGDAEAADKLVECAVAAVDPSLPEEVEEEVRLAILQKFLLLNLGYRVRRTVPSTGGGGGGGR